MRALIVYSHPKEGSFNAAVRDLVVNKLTSAGIETRVTDLYARGFDPRLTAQDLDCYLDITCNQEPVRSDVDDLRWCDTLIFVYPTWWYGLPAMLKGWLDRVLVPDVAFVMPDETNANIRPGLMHIKRIAVFTTCGASWWLTTLIGAPGKKTLLRGVRSICARACKTIFAAHYLMDSSTDESRRAHLARVARKMDGLIGTRPAPVAKASNTANA